MSDSVEPEWPHSFVPAPPLLPCKSECLPGDSAATATFRKEDPQADSSNRDCLGDAQNVAIERLVMMKQGLRALDPELFWRRLMEHMTAICGAQYAFVARRVSADEQVAEQGGHRPCLFGTAFYYDDGHHKVGMHRHRYFAGGNPLSHMDEEKPCLIPENLGSFISLDQDQLPFAAEGYLAVPLFAGTKCIAHFGLMWSEPGLKKRCLPWSFLEMVLYSLEDLIVQRICDETGTSRGNTPSKEDVQDASSAGQNQNQPIDDDTHFNIANGHADFACQQLKPYARSLSHELRTPMQGIVGMLDVMHATVREAMLGKPSPNTGCVFQSLKEGIEMVQDSARRAVEAADNVVHAYDLNMQVPKTPQLERENEFFGGPVQSPVATCEPRPNILIEGSNIPVNPYKRRRSNPAEWSLGSTPKPKTPRTSPQKGLSPRSEEVKNAVHESDKIIHASPAQQIEAVMANMMDPRPSLAVRRSAPHLMLEGINVNTKGSLRFTKLRDLLRLVIKESLHVGGRPDFAVTSATELGEKIEVRSRSSNGEVFSKTINWFVDSAFPDTLFVDDRDLAKLISCVFLNAVKFTNTGSINVCATISRKNSDVFITIQDTGPGIPEAFLPKLFKPFAREDTSTTRSKDGLGLGLLVAKGLARKMGGDLICVRSETSGPAHGSEFEIRIPVNQQDPSIGPLSPTKLTPPQLSDPRLSSSSNSPLYSLPSPSLLPPPGQPLQQPSPCPTDESPPQLCTPQRPAPSASLCQGSIDNNTYDAKLGEKHPLTFLVAEDNQINLRVLVNMLKRLGYKDVYQACNGTEAVRVMREVLASQNSSQVCAKAGNEFLTPERPKKLKPVDLVLMDLWMPEMDGYEATSRILQLIDECHGQIPPNPQPSTDTTSTTSTTPCPTPPSRPMVSPTVFAVSADVTDEALGRASKVGMKGYMTKPYKLTDLERLILGFCGAGDGTNTKPDDSMDTA